MAYKIIDSEKKTAGNVCKMFAMNFCIIFTATMLLCMVFGLVFADEAAKEGIFIGGGIAAFTVMAVLLQLIFFTPYVIKRMAYVPRIALFGVCLYVVTSAFGVVLNWFSADNIWAWVSFTIAYLAILGIMTLIFSIIYKRETKALNEGLKKFEAS